MGRRCDNMARVEVNCTRASSARDAQLMQQRLQAQTRRPAMRCAASDFYTTCWPWQSLPVVHRRATAAQGAVAAAAATQSSPVAALLLL